MLSSWVSLCQSKGVPCNDKFKLSAVLGEAVKIRQWNIWGLPKDDFSTDNAITVDQGRRWPLCIDPQVRAVSYVDSLLGCSGPYRWHGPLLMPVGFCIHANHVILDSNIIDRAWRLSDCSASVIQNASLIHGDMLSQILESPGRAFVLEHEMAV